MAASRRCDECLRIKRCKLHVEPSPLGEPHKIYTYLCATCRKELGI